MARPNSVSRVLINGHLPQGEIFTWGFWMGGAPTDQASAQTWVNGVRDEFQIHAKTALCGELPSTAGYDSVTLYSYPSSGSGAAFVAEATIATGAGTSTDPLLPLQCAWVVTLRTGLPGRSRRGRMYIPIIAESLTAHQLTQGQLDSLLGSVQDFIQGVDNLTTGTNVVVVSQVGAGQANNVTEVSADSRLDIQRRRAEAESVLYTSSQAVTP